MAATHPDTTSVPGPLGVRLRSRFVWWAMRVLPYQRWRAAHEAGWTVPLERVLLRGDIQVFGGIAPHVRLSAPHFEPWGAQAFDFLTGNHEVMVQEAMRRVLPPGGTLIDVGTNVGVMTLMAAAIVGPQGRVVGLDAQRECIEAARANVARNGFDHVSLIHAAAGAYDGETEVVIVADSLWTRPASVGDHELEIRRDTVRIVTLDELVAGGEAPRPDVVKIDVEGAELDVIAGMTTLLREVRPVVICEMHGKNEAFEQTMVAAGYRVTNLDGPEPISQADGNAHAICEPI